MHAIAATYAHSHAAADDDGASSLSPPSSSPSPQHAVSLGAPSSYSERSEPRGGSPCLVSGERKKGAFGCKLHRHDRGSFCHRTRSAVLFCYPYRTQTSKENPHNQEVSTCSSIYGTIEAQHACLLMIVSAKEGRREFSFLMLVPLPPIYAITSESRSSSQRPDLYSVTLPCTASESSVPRKSCSYLGTRRETCAFVPPPTQRG